LREEVQGYANAAHSLHYRSEGRVGDDMIPGCSRLQENS
jgi:hypothetical protein